MAAHARASLAAQFINLLRAPWRSGLLQEPYLTGVVHRMCGP